MTKTQIADYNAAMGPRLAAIVAKKLGADVSFIRWDRLPTGADLPVFRVPAHLIGQAQALGLTVEQ